MLYTNDFTLTDQIMFYPPNDYFHIHLIERLFINVVTADSFTPSLLRTFNIVPFNHLIYYQNMIIAAAILVRIWIIVECLGLFKVKFHHD